MASETNNFIHSTAGCISFLFMQVRLYAIPQVPQIGDVDTCRCYLLLRPRVPWTKMLSLKAQLL